MENYLLDICEQTVTYDLSKAEFCGVYNDFIAVIKQHASKDNSGTSAVNHAITLILQEFPFNNLYIGMI